MRSRITSKQRAARRVNIAIARQAKKKGVGSTLKSKPKIGNILKSKPTSGSTFKMKKIKKIKEITIPKKTGKRGLRF